MTMKLLCHILLINSLSLKNKLFRIVKDNPFIIILISIFIYIVFQINIIISKFIGNNFDPYEDTIFLLNGFLGLVTLLVIWVGNIDFKLVNYYYPYSYQDKIFVAKLLRLFSVLMIVLVCFFGVFIGIVNTSYFILTFYSATILLTYIILADWAINIVENKYLSLLFYLIYAIIIIVLNKLYLNYPLTHILNSDIFTNFFNLSLLTIFNLSLIYFIRSNKLTSENSKINRLSHLKNTNLYITLTTFLSNIVSYYILIFTVLYYWIKLLDVKLFNINDISSNLLLLISSFIIIFLIFSTSYLESFYQNTKYLNSSKKTYLFFSFVQIFICVSALLLINHLNPLLINITSSELIFYCILFPIVGSIMGIKYKNFIEPIIGLCIIFMVIIGLYSSLQSISIEKNLFFNIVSILTLLFYFVTKFSKYE